MNEKTIQIESMTYPFLIHEDKWQLKLPKSQTFVKDIRQMALINQASDFFVPSFVEEEDDQFIFTFMVGPHVKQWEDICKLDRKDKLRLLGNLARFKQCLTTRMTFFLHPDHLIVDDNLIPSFVYRGIRDVVPPYQIDEETFLFQYKCLIVALFSKKYNFDELYAGSLNQAKDTEFERQVVEMDDLDTLIKLLNDHYIKEKIETERKMQIVSKKQFRLYKQLTFIMIAFSVLLTIVFIYLNFLKVPYQGQLLEANRYFLSLNFGNVIDELEDENPEKLPGASKYVLAYSYIKSETLSTNQKETILKNISIKSDPNYLLYWIYNGRGDFNKTIDIAKYIDDPQLIMYGLIKQIESAKNDPTLSGTEREKKVQNYEEQYKGYAEKYELDSLLKPETSDPAGKDEEETKSESSQTEETPEN